MEFSPVSFEHLYFVPDIADAADIFDDAAAALNEALTGPADEQVRAEAARLTEVARRGLCDVVIGSAADETRSSARVPAVRSNTMRPSHYWTAWDTRCSMPPKLI